MTRTRVKICGITRAIDARAAARAGADAIGMMLHGPGSPRLISGRTAMEIKEAAGPFVTVVGLFANATAPQIREFFNLHLTCIQLHGDESPELVAELREVQVIKSMPVDSGTSKRLDMWRRKITELKLTNLIGFVLDTSGQSQSGGTGVANDWNAVRSLQRAGAFDNLPPVIAAGGLNPGNVAQVVRDIRPWAVDVSSGVEESKRIKSTKLIEQFIQAAHSA